MKLKIPNRFKVYTKKSLFGKYINVNVIIVFFSFLVLGIFMTYSITSYWTNTKLQELDRRSENYAEYIRTNISVNQSDSKNAEGSIVINNVLDIEDLLTFIANDAAVDIVVTTTEGKPVLTVMPTADKQHIEQSGEIPDYKNITIDTASVKKAIMDGSYTTTGTLGGLYSSDRYIAVRPIYYRKDVSAMGAVVVTSGTEETSSFTNTVMQSFGFSALGALAIMILAIGAFSYNLVRPLKQMAQAAKQFGKGDFSVRVNESTNDEIGELAVAFNSMADSLSQSETTRKSFVANVSHELKTPMTTIAGFIDGILDGTIPPEKHRYYLSIVSEEIKRLSRLVRSMLDLSRIDSGELRINYTTFDMFSTLVTIIITYEQEIDKHQIEILGLDSITPKYVYGDKDLLHQVIYNLIENAIKFTNDGGTIEFFITEDAEKTTFKIRNSGQGIKKAEIPLVFDRFYKTDKSRSKDKKGLGLGLYLVRSIIRLHGGDIHADSVYGEYTEFEFYIPKKNDK